MTDSAVYVHPGDPFGANVADQGMPMSVITDMGSTTMLERPAQPEELAPAYVFLASDADVSFITGEVIAQTGGLTVSR